MLRSANELKLAEKSTIDDEPTTFVLTLKNVRPADRTDGRKESVVNFEFHWDMKSLQPNSDNLVNVTARWQDFKPTFRGREDTTSGIKLDPSHITECVLLYSISFREQRENNVDSFLCQAILYVQEWLRSSER